MANQQQQPATCGWVPSLGTLWHEGWDAAPGMSEEMVGLAAGVRGSGGSGRCRPLRCTLLRCTDRAGTTGRGKQATRGPGIGSRGENRGRSSDGGKELPGCWWWEGGSGASAKIFLSRSANCGIHALSYSRFVIIQGRWQGESGEHMQILALGKIWPFLE